MVTCFADRNAGHELSDAIVLQKGYMEEEYTREKRFNLSLGTSKQPDGMYSNNW